MRRTICSPIVWLELATVFAVLSATTYSRCQEPRHIPSPATDQAVQTSRSRCRDASVCFDAGAYTASVIGLSESDTHSSRLVRLILRFENLSDATIILAYRAHSAFLLDNFKNRFFSCHGSDGPDLSAVGIGIDSGDEIDPQLTLKPHETEIATFDLWRNRSPNQQASHYDFDLMIDEIDPSSKYTVKKHPYLSFRGIAPGARHENQDSGTRDAAR